MARRDLLRKMALSAEARQHSEEDRATELEAKSHVRSRTDRRGSCQVVAATSNVCDAAKYEKKQSMLDSTIRTSERYMYKRIWGVASGRWSKLRQGKPFAN